MSDTLSRLRGAYAEAHTKATEIYDRAQAERRQMTESESGQFEDLVKDARDMEKRLALFEEHEGRARAIEKDRGSTALGAAMNMGGLGGEFRDPLDAPIEDLISGKVSAVEISFRGLKRHINSRGEIEVRSTLTEGANAAGGFLVPTSFRAVLYQHLIQNSVIRQVATILTTDSGERLLLPKTLTHPAAGTIVSEGALINENDPTFGQGTLSAYKYANLIQVSTELEQDNDVDLLGYLAQAMGRALANGSGTDLVLGSGSSKPYGVLPASGTIAQVSGGTGQSGIPTYKELEQIFDAILPAYQARGSWMFSQKTLSNLRQIQDSYGRPLWLPGLSSDAPTTLFGKQFYVDPNVPNSGTSATSILFGDFSTYFIRELPVRFERSIDYAFANDMVAYRAVDRVDGTLLDLTGSIANYKGGTA
jgi:HK97 family phage major capsid protein